MNDKIVTVSSTNNVVKYYIGRMYILYTYIYIYIYIYIFKFTATKVRNVCRLNEN